MNEKLVERKPLAGPENGHRSLPHKILLIEDDDSFAQLIAYAIEQRGGSDVHIATETFEAGNQMSRHSYDLIITDWKLPPFTGFSALRRADHEIALDPLAPADWFLHKKTPVIVLTACKAEEVGREKKLKGRFQFLGVVSKEQAVEKILEAIENLYGHFPQAASASA
ncbi:MAG: response regulator [Proteobacteria bacterium]|nr:MAG: response regulator [Pseudomonadota bacterium]